MNNTRTQAWRRAQAQRNKEYGKKKIENLADFPREKNWKMLYTRSDKLSRALQLGIDYPRVSNAKLKLISREEEKEE